jgi:hypothetical protein
MVIILYGDQEECFRQAAKLNGVPWIRTVHASRTVPGPADVERMLPEIMDALTRPLTPKEKEHTTWTVPDPRVLFEGTLEDAEKFYSQTEKIPTLKNAPICKYTDGLPIVVPTEERVREMLKGTSHKPDELVRYLKDYKIAERVRQEGSSGKKGDPVHFVPMRRTATVEKIATIGVMAGCKPEHMPILLAMAESGGGCGDGRGRAGFAISGPIVKQIEMNTRENVLGPGNPSNRALGRATDLMWRNLGGNIPSVTNCGIWGNAAFNMLPEDAEELPPGWKGLNEECGFKKNESMILSIGITTIMSTHEHFSPGGYRAFQKSGHGGIARRLGVKGVPGPKNWMDYIVPVLWESQEGGIVLMLLPEMAMQLQQAGFKSKEAIYQWLYEKSKMTVGQYRTHSWPDMRTNAWNAVEKTSGKPWKELPDDYIIPAMSDPKENCVIVTGMGEEVAQWLTGQAPNQDLAFGIDPWR